MNEKEYRAADGISRSELWKIHESPEKFKWAQEHPEPPTPALIFGQLVHKLLLQPENFSDEFVIAPNVDRRTKAGREEWAKFEAENTEKTALSEDIYNIALKMVNDCLAAPYVKKLLAGQKEIPYFWTDDMTGEKCKVRLDCLTEVGDDLIIIDYKTTTNAETDTFIKSAIKYGYDFQAAMYIEGVKKCTGKKPRFVFIAQEKDPPYAVNIMQADELFIKRGYDSFRELLGTYHDCKINNNWFGYLGKYNILNSLCLPSYLAAEVE